MFINLFLSNQRSLDLSAPLHIGGLPNSIGTVPIHNKDFVGCIQNIKIDHELIDLNDYLENHLTQPKCLNISNNCETANPCKSGDCSDGLYQPTCYCPVDIVGKLCEEGIIILSFIWT